MHYSYALSMRTIPLRVTMTCLRLAFHVRTGTTTPLKEFPPPSVPACGLAAWSTSSIGNRIWRGGRSATSSPSCTSLQSRSSRVSDSNRPRIPASRIWTFYWRRSTYFKIYCPNPPHHTHSQIKPTLKLSQRSTLSAGSSITQIGQGWLLAQAIRS